jgi:hypothetical protein
MNQYGATFLHSFLNEIDNLVEIRVFGVKEQLCLRLTPRERQVIDTLLLKQVVDFAPATIDNVCHLVHHNPLMILNKRDGYVCCGFITHEKAILDFCRTDKA